MAFSIRCANNFFRNVHRYKKDFPVKQTFRFGGHHCSIVLGNFRDLNPDLEPKRSMKLIYCTLIAGAGGLWWYRSQRTQNKDIENKAFVEITDFAKNDNIPDIIPSREISGPATNLELDLTLYQYQTCPFCCKVRAFLEFYGIPFKVVEVNPVFRQQLKFSKYKKVPILIAEEKESLKKHQLNDSTVIISILGTMVNDLSTKFTDILSYYTPVNTEDDKGKQVEVVLNKYFLMYGESYTSEKEKDIVEEKKWRTWADNELVHILSPNIYRTYGEALDSFNYFSKVGEWEKNFSSIERLTVIYVGATAMYLIGKRLKKKYLLKDDVRDSLYDACKLWMKEIGERKFMGGNVPNLADLAVYGLLNSIEGCIAFKDLLDNTDIGKWYYDVKEMIACHEGYKKLKA